MAFTLGALYEAFLLFINAVAILNEQRFLSKIGWGTNEANNPGFGQEKGVKHQIINLISSVRTLLRVPLIALNAVTLAYLLVLG
ncbi:immediate early response 3-interacting protein 1-like [Oscarella lobularis]|uniref:immediate early response 3-interacting protein 1-like n=1 Tax=Oscarella lobularis TaxID=121494 RepID=UPI0033141F7A